MAVINYEIPLFKVKEFYEWLKKEGKNIEEEEDPTFCIDAITDKMEEMFSELAENVCEHETLEDYEEENYIRYDYDEREQEHNIRTSSVERTPLVWRGRYNF